jgi:hypothetical protein
MPPPIQNAMKNAAVLIPIYKPGLDALETYSLDKSLAVLHDRSARAGSQPCAGRDIFFIGPEGLDLRFYAERYPGIPFIAYAPHYFASIPGYNRLLLSQAFYTGFLPYEFMLILQTDAILLRDELDLWCAKPYDYIGAPWPDGYELFVHAGRFEGENGKRMRVHVGNGGLSLRRVRKCLGLLQEFAGDVIDIFERTGSSEDLFFAFMGALSTDFLIPNEIVASHFAMELKPSAYLAVNGNKAPMGGHAWWKHEPEFWRGLLPDLPAV